MSEPDYYKIGGVIFGTQRLDWALAVLTDWMTNCPESTGGPLDEAKIQKFESSARAYFQRPDAVVAASAKFDAVISRMRLLLANQEAMKASGKMANFDAVAVACNEAHKLLAEVVDLVGYTKLPSTFISDKQIEV